MRKIINKLFNLPSLILVIIIKIYQKTLSPDHSFWAKKIFPFGYCRFYPTCSQFGQEIIERDGALVGGFKTFRRVLRCRPSQPGGQDPIDKH